MKPLTLFLPLPLCVSFFCLSLNIYLLFSPYKPFVLCDVGFYSFLLAQLPFIFHRCQQQEHRRHATISVTNCHRLCCSLDVTRYFLSSIYLFVSFVNLHLLHMNKNVRFPCPICKTLSEEIKCLIFMLFQTIFKQNVHDGALVIPHYYQVKRVFLDWN